MPLAEVLHLQVTIISFGLKASIDNLHFDFLTEHAYMLECALLSSLVSNENQMYTTLNGFYSP